MTTPNGDRPIQRIALLMPPSSRFVRGLLEGISAYGRQHARWHFVIGNHTFDTRDFIEQARPQGIITLARVPEVVWDLSKFNIPLVNCSGVVQKRTIHTVRVDNDAIGHMAADYFLAKGFQAFAYCARARRKTGIQRAVAYRDRVRQHGYDCDVFIDFAMPNSADPDHDQRFLSTQMQRLLQWVDQLPKPVALHAGNDLIATQVAECCARLNLNVPDEVAILGVDDDDVICRMTRPSLSSIALPAYQIGFSAADMLDQLMQGRRVEQQRLFGPVEVVARESTDVTAVSDPVVLKALRFIRDSVPNPVTVEDVSAHVAVSRRVLEMRFRDALNRTVYREIQQSRIERSCQLLREPELSIDQVAAMAGFSSRERLSVVFRQHTGETPAGYRRRFLHQR